MRHTLFFLEEIRVFFLPMTVLAIDETLDLTLALSFPSLVLSLFGFLERILLLIMRRT